MKRFLLLATLLFLAACSVSPGPTAIPSPIWTPTPVTFAEDTAREFLKAWSAGDYNAMYALLAPSRKATVPADQFIARYQGIVKEATIKATKTTFVSSHEEGNDAQVAFTVSFETNAVGTIQQDNVMSLRRENSRWGVLWNPGLIFKELADGGTVHFYPLASARADIFDRKSRPFTAPQTQIIVEVVPLEMKNESAVLAGLARLFGLQPGAIRAMYSRFPGDWRTPIGTITPDQAKANADVLNQPGIHTDTTRDTRTYPQGEVAAHVIGYVGQINADELAQLSIKGYREGDLIGKSGLEYAMESYLAGERGGRLNVLTPEGIITATLANVPAQQSQNVYTTLDVDAQTIAEKALGDRNGAVVMMDVSNGDVLAMVSHPAFDPNKLTQHMTATEFRALLNDPNAPLINRAAQSAFPPGSVFKIVAYAAAIEKGIFTPTSMFEDPGYWDGMGKNARKYCWIYPITNAGHGKINLSSALTQSCDVTFYQVGQKLDQTDRNLMTTFARAFGLGSKTGIEISEAEGLVPDPKAGNWGLGDAVNMVIGQGTMLTSPLQIADMLAAVANGGTLYKPRLVASVGSIAVGSVQVSPREARGTLPISAGTLASIREALKKVTQDKSGTAYGAFRGAKIISAGKTGTAEVLKTGEPHAWFAGYAPADNPKIALVVLVEHGGEGAVAAAPVFREIVDKYLALPGK